MSEPEASAVTIGPATAGDADARRFEALALPHLAHLYRLAVRLTGAAADAEDLVHETYMKGLAAFAALREPDRIRPWLSRILARLVLDRHRAGDREVAVGDLAELDRCSLFDLIWDEDPLPYSDALHRDVLAQFPTTRSATPCSDCPRCFAFPSSCCTSRT